MSPLIGFTQEDLTLYARIRGAALTLFSERGVGATSIRDIAARADVSPGAVQHHFGSKARLCEVVYDHVSDLLADAFAPLQAQADPAASQSLLVETILSLGRGNAVELRFVGRGVADSEPGAGRIFGELLTLLRAQWDRLAAAGLIRPELDVSRGVMNIAVLTLGSSVMQSSIERHLPAPLSDRRGRERWEHAQRQLLELGLYQAEVSAD